MSLLTLTHVVKYLELDGVAMLLLEFLSSFTKGLLSSSSSSVHSSSLVLACLP